MISARGIARAAVVAVLLSCTLATGLALAETFQWRVEDGGNGHFYEPVPVPWPGIQWCTWITSYEAAASAGGYLATLTSAEENTFVFGLIKNRPEFWVYGGGNYFGPWLGGYQPSGSPEPNGGWRWVTDETWVFSHWATGEPNNQGGNENELQYFGRSGVIADTWNDGWGPAPIGWNPAIPGYIVEYVPEPATLSLLAVGGLGVFLRRKRQLLAALGGFVLAIVLLTQPALAGPYPQTREYMLGDIDGIHYDGPGSVDDVYVDPAFAAWNLPVGAANGIQPFDAVHQNQVVPFTFTFPLASGETVVGATLTIGLRSMGGNPENDRLDLEPDRGSGVDTFFRYDFSDLGWLPVASSGVAVRTIDLATVYGCYDHPNTPDDYLPLLQDGKFNAKVHDDMAIDYANLTIEVMPEPVTLALLAVGGLLALRRRR